MLEIFKKRAKPASDKEISEMENQRERCRWKRIEGRWGVSRRKEGQDRWEKHQLSIYISIQLSISVTH